MIVFDASTLILLAKAELLDLFLDHYPAGAVIPQAIEGECVVSPTRPEWKHCLHYQVVSLSCCDVLHSIPETDVRWYVVGPGTLQGTRSGNGNRNHAAACAF